MAGIAAYSLVLFLIIFVLAGGGAFLARGGDDWWVIDFVSGTNVLWGDDAYRFYLAKLAFKDPDVYFFNFALPLAIFFDGTLLSLFAGEQLPVRLIKAALLALSAVLLADAGAKIVGRRFSHLAVLAVFSFPLFFLVAISFFGESWLIIVSSFFISSIVGRKYLVAAILVSILPFLRIEGLLFVFSFSMVCLGSRHKVLAVIPYIPGLIYVLLIQFVGPGMGDFIGWRTPMNQVYAGTEVWYQFRPELFWGALNIPLLLLAALGLWLRREFRPLLLPLIGVPLLFVILSATDRSSFEPRYFTMSIPILPLGIFCLYEKLTRLVQFPRGVFVVAAAAVCMGSFGFNVNSIHVVNNAVSYFLNTSTLPDEMLHDPFSMDTYFKKISAADKEGYQELANAIETALLQHPEIRTMIVSDFLLFYFLDAEAVPDHVLPVFALFGRGRLGPLLGESLSAGYYHKPPYFSYFSLALPYKRDPLVLYVDYIPKQDYPLKWVVAGHHMAIFAGRPIGKDDVSRLRHQDIVVPLAPP